MRTWDSPERPKTCAVIGAGPLGRLCAIVLAHKGHPVTVFDRDPTRLTGFDQVGISTSNHLEGLHRFEMLAEVTGNQESLETVLEKSGAGSSILLLVLPYARRTFNFERLVAYDKTIVGSVGSNARDFHAAIDLVGKLDLAPYFEHILPLSRFEDAWTMTRTHECFKVLLKVG